MVGAGKNAAPGDARGSTTDISTEAREFALGTDAMSEIATWAIVVAAGISFVRFRSRFERLNEKLFGKDPLRIQGSEFTFAIVGSLMTVFGTVFLALSIADRIMGQG